MYATGLFRFRFLLHLSWWHIDLQHIMEKCMHHLELVFKHLKEANLKLKLSKCPFFKKHLHYLGHLISEQGMQAPCKMCQTYNTWKNPSMWKNFNISWAWHITIGSFSHWLLILPDPSTNSSGKTQSSSGHGNIKQPSNISNKLL